VFHCFAGSWQEASRVIELGGLVSFGGVLTFKSAQAIRDTLASCPVGSFMLETDSPYLAPEPHRGQRNEPAFVRHVAQATASLRGESPEELARHTNEAAEHFFRFRPKSI
jgi:TatD DNase family protein